MGRLAGGRGDGAAEHQAGAEKAAALVTSVFLHGTKRRKEDGPVSPA